MKLQRHAFWLLIILTTFFFTGCEEVLFDSRPPGPDTGIEDPPPVTDDPSTWENDITAVPLPKSDGFPIDPAYKNGNEKPIIVVLGSSTAAGNGASSPDKSWVELMKAQLRKDNKDVDVVNLAADGLTSFDIMPDGKRANNITKALESNPFFVIINISYEDVEEKYTFGDFVGNYKELGEILRAKEIRYVVTGLQPRDLGNESLQRRLFDVNEKIYLNQTDHFTGGNQSMFKKLSDGKFAIKDYFAAGDNVNLNDIGHSIVNGYIFNSNEFKETMGYK